MKMQANAFILGLLFFIQGTFAEEVKISFSEIPEKLSMNKEVVANNLNADASGRLIGAARSFYYPTLNLVGSLGENKTFTENFSGNAAYLQGSWNLYHGGRDSAIIEQANRTYEITKISNRIRFQEILTDAQVLFSDLVRITNFENLYLSELEYTKKHKQMAQKKVSTGLTSRVDILEFEVREDFIAAQLRAIKSDKDQNQQKLRAIFGLSETDVVIPAGDIKNYNINNKFSESSIVDTLNYKKLLFQKNRLELEKDAIRSEFMPRVDLQASYGRLTFQDFSENHSYERNVALTLTIPLFSGLSTVSSSQSKAFEISSIDSNLSQLALNLRSEIQNLETQYDEFKDLLVINERRLGRAEQYYDLTLSEYKRGVKNSPDLVTATERLFESKRLDVDLKNRLQVTYFKHEKVILKN